MKSIVSLWNMRKGSGLFKKAFLIYIALAIVPTVLVTVAATFIYTRGRSTQSHQLVERYAKQGETIIHERMQMYESVFYRLLADKEFIGLCEQINAETEHEYSTAGRKAADLMQTFIYTYSDIRGAAFISDAGECISSSKWYSSSGDMSWTDPENSSRIWSSVTDMQNMTFLAMENLSRYSMEFPDYVVLMGMEKAKELLINTDMKIYAIACFVGYPDQKYFSKVFREYTGVSAKQFAMENGGKGNSSR